MTDLDTAAIRRQYPATGDGQTIHALCDEVDRLRSASFYERFKQELPQFHGTDPATHVVGECLRAAKRAEMFYRGIPTLEDLGFKPEGDAK